MARNLAFPALALLSACATSAPPAVSPVPRPVAAAAISPGLARLYGRDVAAVLALLGPAALDRSEGVARHLQFVRPACVLDVYFYPADSRLAVNGAAARKPDGSRIDPGTCLGLIAP
ncbi:MAG: hypothetical protein ACOYKQ_12630 [Polymorphobacter sp.]